MNSEARRVEGGYWGCGGDRGYSSACNRPVSFAVFLSGWLYKYLMGQSKMGQSFLPGASLLRYS